MFYSALLDRGQNKVHNDHNSDNPCNELTSTFGKIVKILYSFVLIGQFERHISGIDGVVRISTQPIALYGHLFQQGGGVGAPLIHDTFVHNTCGRVLTRGGARQKRWTP